MEAHLKKLIELSSRLEEVASEAREIIDEMDECKKEIVSEGITQASVIGVVPGARAAKKAMRNMRENMAVLNRFDEEVLSYSHPFFTEKNLLSMEGYDESLLSKAFAIYEKHKEFIHLSRARLSVYPDYGYAITYSHIGGLKGLKSLDEVDQYLERITRGYMDCRKVLELSSV